MKDNKSMIIGIVVLVIAVFLIIKILPTIISIGTNVALLIALALIVIFGIAFGKRIKDRMGGGGE